METNKTAMPKKSNFDLQNLIEKIKSRWYVFALSTAVFLTIAYLYGSYSTKEYKVTGKLLVPQQDQNAASRNEEFVSDISTQLNAKENTQNELQILKSRSLLHSVVNELNLSTKVTLKDGLKETELFKDVPFEVVITDVTDSIKARKFSIQNLDNSNYHIKSDGSDLNWKVKFGEKVVVGPFSIQLDKKSVATLEKLAYNITVVSEDAAVRELMGRYDASFSEKGATTVDLTLNYPQPDKGRVILQTIMDNYLKEKRLNRIHVADSAIKLIDNRLALVTGQLSGVEKDLQKYRSSNGIANIEEQSKALVGNANNYNEKVHDLQVKLSIVKNIEQYLDNPDNKNVIPSNAGIEESSFSNGLNRYNELLVEREKQALSYTATNPVVINLDDQIQSSRNSLVENIKSYKREIQLGLSDISGQRSSYSSQIQGLPEIERVFQDFSRQQNMKQQLYLYLLQKREEAAISQTAAISAAKVIDPAVSDINPFKPNTQLLYLMAIIMGNIIPLSWLTLSPNKKSLLVSKTNIVEMVNMEVIGEIGHSTSGKKIVIDSISRTLVAENFKTLRTNLQYVLKPTQCNVIMITSTMRGEGKSFVAANLGKSLSLLDKKVAFIELDLRMPMLSEYMGISNHSMGFSDYAASKTLDINRILKPVDEDLNSYIITSGPIPLNPSELLQKDRLPELINKLREDFDYIVIDSPPVGLVSDSLIIEKYVDMTIYVVRENYSYVSQIDLVNSLKKSRKIKELHLLINDISIPESESFQYGYYEKPEKKSLLNLTPSLRV